MKFFSSAAAVPDVVGEPKLERLDAPLSTHPDQLRARSIRINTLESAFRSTLCAILRELFRAAVYDAVLV